MQINVTTWNLLCDLTKRDFKTRYLGSLLGSYWNIVHPLVMILIYTLVFSNVMKARLGGSSIPFSYSIYLCTGLLPWNLLSEIVNRGAVSILDNAAFLKKLAIEPVMMFVVTWMSAWVNFLIAMGMFLVVLMVLKPISMLFLAEYLVIVGLMSLFGLGLAVTIGCLNVYLRDFQQITSIVFQLWFWFTPLVYAVDVLPEIAKQLLWYNPAFAFVEPLHQLLYYDTQPAAHYWGLMVLWCALSLGLAAFVYNRTRLQLRDYI